MIRIFNHYVSKMAVILLMLELRMLELMMLLASASVVSALWLADGGGRFRADNLYASSLTFALVVIFSMSALGMYQHSAREGIRITLIRIMPSLALGANAVLLTRLVMFKSAASALLEARLIFIGSGQLARECMELAGSKFGFHQFHVVGCVAVPGEANLLPMGEALLVMARRYEASEIIVTVGHRRGNIFPPRQLLVRALGGVKVIDAATFFEREACQIRLDSLQPSYLIFGDGFDQSFARAGTKRLFDLLASAVITIASLPVMLAAAVAIAVEDGGPVFYRQQRVGKNGRPFQMLKFRRMRSGAEDGGAPTWAAQNDPRVTRVGRWLRLLRIDELPQMANVFKSAMSFVGPRPERAYFVEQLRRDVPYYNVRHSIKPGITGQAQVRYQYDASREDAIEKLRYDLYYVKNNSLFLDLLILIDTVQVVVFGKDSR